LEVAVNTQMYKNKKKEAAAKAAHGDLKRIDLR
jgi:hypothetical protein